MTNNTIPNVPRALLADLLGNDHDKRIMAERHLLAMLANTPLPTGVDGLVAVKVWEADADWDDHELVVRLSAAQAIIDGLRGEVADLRSMLATVSKAGLRVRTERDQHAKRIGELASHLEVAVTMLTVAGLDENAQVEAMRAALSAGKEGSDG